MIIDLTHTIEEGMPLYPDTPDISIAPITSIKEEGFGELMLSITTHTGTHIDAPLHIFENGKSIELYSLDTFIGSAICIECPAEKSTITAEVIKEVLISFPNLSFLVFRTGWHQYWGKANYFQGFPIMESEAAKLIAESNLKGVCIDAISIDSCDAEILTNHHILLSKGKIITENLTNTKKLPLNSPFELYVIPLKVGRGDGSPARAFARL